MNEHAEIIQNTVFHSYPYNRMGFKPDAPHAEDCEGCLINTEVEKLVAKLNFLSPVEEIVDELRKEKQKLKALTLDRDRAFEKADVVEGESVTELVSMLVDDRKRLIKLLVEIERNINNISIALKLRE